MIKPPFNSVGPLMPLKKVGPVRGGTTRLTSPLCCADSPPCANAGRDAAPVRNKSNVRHDSTWARLNIGMVETPSPLVTVGAVYDRPSDPTIAHHGRS